MDSTKREKRQKHRIRPSEVHAGYTAVYSDYRLNGKIANKSVDQLLYYAGRLGIEAKAKFAQTHNQAVEEELAMADTAGRPCR